jgi:preprotein translocase subunit YajC
MALQSFIGEAAASKSTGPSQMWIFILIFMAIWFLSIAPARKRQKQQKLMLERLRVGDRVLLSSAIFAKVISIKGQNLTVEIAKGVRIEVLRDAVRQLLSCECGGDEKNCCAAECESPEELTDSSSDGVVDQASAKKPPRSPGRAKTKK